MTEQDQSNGIERAVQLLAENGLVGMVQAIQMPINEAVSNGERTPMATRKSPLAVGWRKAEGVRPLLG